MNNFYMPPEWYPHQCCYMAWPCHESTWAHIGIARARLVYASIANAIAKFEKVFMLANPNDCYEAKNLCNNQNIEILPMFLNDSWLRDTGPTFLLNKEHNQLAGIAWKHNAWGNNYDDYELDALISTKILENLNIQIFKAPIIMEGGSFHTDGAGTILTTKECLLNPNRNPDFSQLEIENILCEYLNAKKVIWLNQGLVDDETDGHIDEIACFITEGKILVCVTEDTSDENYLRIQENLEILKSTSDAKGRNLEIYTVTMPPKTYINNIRLTLSYINFYRTNNAIIMPSFGYSKYDNAALEVFKLLFKNDSIIQIPALDLFTGGGGIHCITQQQPKINGVRLD